MERKEIMRRIVKSNASAHAYWAHEFIGHVMHESAKNNEMIRHIIFSTDVLRLAKGEENPSTRSLIFFFFFFFFFAECAWNFVRWFQMPFEGLSFVKRFGKILSDMKHTHYKWWF